MHVGGDRDSLISLGYWQAVVLIVFCVFIGAPVSGQIVFRDVTKET